MKSVVGITSLGQPGAAMAPLRLHLGCGGTRIPGWINIDSSLGARLGQWPRIQRLLHAVLPASLLPSPTWGPGCKRMDLTRPWDYSDGSVQEIYSSHFLEHLSLDEARRVLREAHRVLVTGGVLRLVVPDFSALVDRYVAARATGDVDAVRKFHDDTGFFTEMPPRKWWGLPMYHVKRRHNHVFLYDEAALAAELRAAGFARVERRELGEGLLEGAARIDVPDRFQSAICFEAMRS